MDLLLSERVVLEAILNKAETLDQITESTGLTKLAVNNILPGFLVSNIIKYEGGKYYLNNTEDLQWKKEINKIENIKMEVKEILSSSVDLMNGGSKLSLKKIYLSEFEEKLLSIELSRVDKLIKDLQSNSCINKNVKDMKVVYWGVSNYGDVVNNICS